MRTVPSAGSLMRAAGVASTRSRPSRSTSGGPSTVAQNSVGRALAISRAVTNRYGSSPSSSTDGSASVIMTLDQPQQLAAPRDLAQGPVDDQLQREGEMAHARKEPRAEVQCRHGRSVVTSGACGNPNRRPVLAAARRGASTVHLWHSRIAMATKVIVLGGGVAGMTAAHELARRPGFEVVVFELRAVAGGKARSMDAIAGVGGRRALPGEHGFRFFPGFYKHVPDTMRRIPYEHQLHGVLDNLVMSTQVQVAREDARNELVAPAHL